MSCIELFNIISKPWASINEIMQITGCGRDNAIKVRDKIIDDIHKDGKEVPNGKTIIVPMKNVIDYLNIDLDHIIKIAKLEQILEVIANDRAENYASISK